MNYHRGAAAHFNKTLHRGDVVWLQLPQDLTSTHHTDAVDHKTRPFVVLNDKLTIQLNHHGDCIRSDKLIGIDGTSKPDLVQSRPHITFAINGGDRTTYALTDSLRTIDTLHQHFGRAYNLCHDDQIALNQNLNTVLQPEQRFYLRYFFKNIFMPGELWEFETPTRKGLAMILIRRGSFFLDGHEDGGRSRGDNQHYPSRFTPYLVAAFRQASVQTLRGITWKDVDIMALHERSFLRQKGSMSEETVGIFLNNLRSRVGLTPITYAQPTIKSAVNRLLFSFFTPRLS